MSINIYKVTPRQVAGYIDEIWEAGLVPFVKASPGTGKSSVVKQVSKRHGLKVIDHRLSTSAPEDLSGLPRFINDKAEFVPFADLFPTDDLEVPAGYNGWCVFLDEFNSAVSEVQAASYKLVLDKMTGQRNLHPNVVQCLAGNLDTDRAITNMISTAMQSRVITLLMEVSHKEWLMDVAIPEGYDERIVAFLNAYEDKLMNFRPDHNDETFACPRTWEFMNGLIKGKEVKDEKVALYAGTIGSGIAVEFNTFTKVFHNLVSVRDILADPSGCHVPQDSNSKWAVITQLLNKVTDENFTSMAIYADRFDMPFRILFYRSGLVRHPDLRTHPAFAAAMIQLTKYLN